MTVAVGLLLGIGLLLCVSPLLWPDRPIVPSRVRVLLGRIDELLVQAGLGQVRPAVFAVVVVLAATSAAAVAALLTSVVAVTVLAGLAGGVLPIVILTGRARARRRASRVLWPDVVDHLVSALRSGATLVDALASLGEAGPASVAPAFRAFARDIRATGDADHAFDALKARLADPVADRIVEAMRMVREVGGTELTGVLRALSASLRQDAALRSEVEARQSWIRNAARLGVAAPWVVLLLLASRPEAATAYDSPTGAALIGVGFVVTVIAYRLMIALGRLPEERRWFA